MKKQVLCLLVVGFFLGTMVNVGNARDGRKTPLVPVGASDIYAPNGFDNNDNVQVVVEGYFPNSCYKVAPAVVDWKNFEKGEIRVQPQAYRYNGVCLPVMIHYEQVVDLGVLDKQGKYTVKVGRRDLAAPLNIGKAKYSTPDDLPEGQVYAPVKSVSVVSRKEKTIRIEGEFPLDCMKMEKVLPQNPENRVVAVLPVAKYDREHATCKRGKFPYTAVVKLKDESIKGRYLIHVRSLNGRSFNVIEDF